MRAISSTPYPARLRSASKSIPLAVALAVVLSACARAASPGAEAPTGSTVAPTTDAITAPVQAGPTFSEFPAEPPIWSLSYDETQETLHGWFWGDAGLDDSCDGLWFADPSTEPCARSYFGARGVSDAAIDLLFQHGVSVFDVEGAGPVKVLQVAHWEEIIVGNPNLAAESDQYYIVTPMGRLETWPSRSGSFEDPRAESVLEALEDYFRAQPEFSELDDSTAILEFVGNHLSAPTQTSDGWMIEIQTGIRAGCAGCGIPFTRRSILLFDAGGTPTEYRLVDVCYRPYDSGDSDKDAALAEFGADIPMCESAAGE